jgi:hypothetical protein
MPNLVRWMCVLTLAWACPFGAVAGAQESAPQDTPNPAESKTPSAEGNADGEVKLESRDTGAAGPVYAPSTVEDAKQRTLAWAKERGADEAALARVEAVWKSVPEGAEGETILDTVVTSFGVVDTATGEFLARLTSAGAAGTLPEFNLVQATAEPFYQANLKVFVARHWVGRRLVDEALALVTDLDPARVVDPAALLFLKAVCEHQLLMKTPGLKTLDALLKRTLKVPVRYTAVAELMKYDLEALEDDSLNELAQKMRDVERRLELGRGGKKVQEKEREIIEGLEKIIKKLEQQAQGQGSGDGQSGGNDPGTPADDSRVKGQTAPGNVDPKKLSKNGGWGSLPDKQRAKAKDLVTREFPSHYREAIEEYTRKAAGRAAAKGN